MDANAMMKPVGTFLFLCLFVSVVISAMIFLFVFVINWEDWFFGIKLDGLPAGLCLLAKALGAAAIVIILAQYPRHQVAGILAGTGYFGLLFFDSAVTIQKNTYGRQSFSILLAILFLVPVLLLIIHLVMLSPGNGEHTKIP
jgi:hypothetical protein